MLYLSFYFKIEFIFILISLHKCASEYGFINVSAEFHKASRGHLRP